MSGIYKSLTVEDRRNMARYLREEAERVDPDADKLVDERRIVRDMVKELMAEDRRISDNTETLKAALLGMADAVELLAKHHDALVDKVGQLEMGRAGDGR